MMTCLQWTQRFAWSRAGLLAALLGVLALAAGCRQDAAPVVVVYAAQDQVYAEPILQDFTRQTGIRVEALYDSEAVKTVGLAQRLLAERTRPVCDVFWGNEELRARQLAAAGVLVETNGWAAFGFRSRRLVINTNLVRNLPADGVVSLSDLTNAVWRGRVALAYPLFGTTCTHFLALRQAWGAEAWRTWCRALQANKPWLVEGNSDVVRRVGRGEAWIGLTDSDDVAVGLRNGLPLAALPPTRETLLIPNTVCLVRNGPNPAAAEKLFRRLLEPAVAESLVAAQALEGAEPGARPFLRVEWPEVLANLETGVAEMKSIFLR